MSAYDAPFEDATREARYRDAAESFRRRTGRFLSRKIWEYVDSTVPQSAPPESQLRRSDIESVGGSQESDEPRFGYQEAGNEYLDEHHDPGDDETLEGSDDFSKMMIEEERTSLPRRYQWSYSADDDRRWREYERGNHHAFSAPLPPGHPLRGRGLGSFSSSGSDPINEQLRSEKALEGNTLFTKKLHRRPWWELYRDPKFHPQTTWVVPPEDRRERAEQEQQAQPQQQVHRSSPIPRKFQSPLSTQQEPKAFPSVQQESRSSLTQQQKAKPLPSTQQEVNPLLSVQQEDVPSTPPQQAAKGRPETLSDLDKEALQLRKQWEESLEEIRSPELRETFRRMSPKGFANDVLKREQEIRDWEESQKNSPTNNEFDWNLTNSPEPVMASTPAYTPRRRTFTLEEEARAKARIDKMCEEASAEYDRQKVRSRSASLSSTNSNNSTSTGSSRKSVFDYQPGELTGYEPTPDYDPQREVMCALSRILLKKEEKKKQAETKSKPVKQQQSEERQQEIKQLRTMSTRLHAASRSIRDAYNNAKQLVHSVDTARPAAKPCQHCGHVSQSSLSMIWTGIKGLFMSPNSDRNQLTWFGLVSLLFFLWYITEIAISEYFGNVNYATTMHGYGVHPDLPRYPFAIMTMLSWIPPFSWIRPLLSSLKF